MNLELVFYNKSTLLESPCWSPREEAIYCVSIDQCLIYRVNPANSEVQSFRTNGPVGCVLVESDGTLLSAEKEGIYRTNPISGEKLFVIQLEENPDMRYNDGKLDPTGRFLVGTKGLTEEMPGAGKLFSYANGIVQTLIENTSISNGIGFSIAGDRMYFIDTPTRKVACYNYDRQTGQITFNRYVVEIEGSGYPDGMCVDLDDQIWVAEWEGGRVCKWDPATGKKVTEVQLPCKLVTSCCLGGSSLEYLYITTARDKAMDEMLAGALFRIKVR